jgi:hypothetical protein
MAKEAPRWVGSIYLFAAALFIVAAIFTDKLGFKILYGSLAVYLPVRAYLYFFQNRSKPPSN